MTQVQQMSDAAINRGLTELLGYKVVRDESTGMYRMVNPQGKEFGMSRPTEGLVWHEYAYPFSTDPAASMEVQATAIAKNGELYVRRLNLCFMSDHVWDALYPDQIAVLLTATPRQRAEAALMTLRDNQ